MLKPVLTGRFSSEVCSRFIGGFWRLTFVLTAASSMVFLSSHSTFAQDFEDIIPSLERIVDVSDSGSVPSLAVAPFEHFYGNVKRGVQDLQIDSLEQHSGGRCIVYSSDETGEILKLANLYDEKLYSRRHISDFSRLSGIDFILVGRVQEFEILKVEPGIGPFPLTFILPEGAFAQVVIDYALISVDGGRIVMEGSVIKERKADDFNAPGLDTWKGSLDFLSPGFERHPIGLPAIHAVDEIALRILEVFPLKGRILERTGGTVIVGFDTLANVAEGDLLGVYLTINRQDGEGNIVWQDIENTGALRVLEVRGATALCEILRGIDTIKEGHGIRIIAE